MNLEREVRRWLMSCDRSEYIPTRCAYVLDAVRRAGAAILLQVTYLVSFVCLCSRTWRRHSESNHKRTCICGFGGEQRFDHRENWTQVVKKGSNRDVNSGTVWTPCSHSMVGVEFGDSLLRMEMCSLPIYDRFRPRFAARAQIFVCGMPEWSIVLPIFQACNVCWREQAKSNDGWLGDRDGSENEDIRMKHQQ